MTSYIAILTSIINATSIHKLQFPGEYPLNVLPYSAIAYSIFRRKHKFTRYELVLGDTGSELAETLYD